MSAEIEIPDGPPWPAALAGGAEVLAELNRLLWALAEDHRPLVADVHARFLGHGLAAGDPTPAGRPPLRSWPVVLRADRAQRLGASEIRASFWEALQRAGTEWS